MDRVIYSEENLSFKESEGKHYLVMGDNTYRISSGIYEPTLFIEFSNKMVTVHNAFTVDELCKAALEGSSITMVSGNSYDAKGVFKLVRKAIELAKDNVDVSYVEGRCFMDYMKEHGAISYETAVDLKEAGMQNSVMSSFIHSKKAGETADGLFYLKSEKEAAKESERFGRVISNNVRFGYGYRPFEGRRQYYAWHGYPNRNDDYFTNAEITEAEFRQIEKEYPVEVSADRETAEIFRNKYVDGHKVIFEGWNRTF